MLKNEEEDTKLSNSATFHQLYTLVAFVDIISSPKLFCNFLQLIVSLLYIVQNSLHPPSNQIHEILRARTVAHVCIWLAC